MTLTLGHEHAHLSRNAAGGHALAEPMTDAAMRRPLTEQGELFERMDDIGGWTYENTIDTVLSSLGFHQERRYLASYAC